LLDPTILLPHFMQAMAAAQADGSVNEFPLSQGAQRRRRQFADVEDAYVYFRGKPLFKDWPDDMVRLYASGGTRPSPNGGGIELIWPPEWEAYYFRTLYTRTWDDLPRLNGLLPTLVIRGADSDTFVTEAAEQAQTLLPAAAFVDIAGHGHLFPQSAPDETRRILGDWLMQIEGKR
jgi:pimeloyl-ACP methyl ester carboxylesterase